MNNKLVISMAALLLAAGCGGSSPATDVRPAAMAEVRATLDAVEAAVTAAYGANNDKFPSSGNPPISLGRPSGARYVDRVSYTFFGSYSYQKSSVFLTLSGTGDPRIDGSIYGTIGVGRPGGKVEWARCASVLRIEDIPPIYSSLTMDQNSCQPKPMWRSDQARWTSAGTRYIDPNEVRSW